MTIRLVHVVIDANDPARLGEFWARALGWQILPADPDEIVIAPAGFDSIYPDPVALPLVLVPVPERKTVQNRLHLDLATMSAEHQAAEVQRLLGLGAAPADVGQGDVPWTVLADPEGNEFCVLDPRPEYADTGPVAAVVAGCRDPQAIAGFWELATGFRRQRSAAEFVSLRSPREVGPYLELLQVPDPKTVKNRVHLDLRPERGEDVGAAVAALRAGGARLADAGQRDVPWTVLADPEGSEFCVRMPWPPAT